MKLKFLLFLLPFFFFTNALHAQTVIFSDCFFSNASFTVTGTDGNGRTTYAPGIAGGNTLKLAYCTTNTAWEIYAFSSDNCGSEPVWRNVSTALTPPPVGTGTWVAWAASCADNALNLGTVTTSVVTTFTNTTAAMGGDVTNSGIITVLDRGVVYGTTLNPTIANNKTTIGSGTGTFSSSISGLSVGTLYHVRAYATNAKGTSYGSDVTFTTSPASAFITATGTLSALTTTYGTASTTGTFNVSGTTMTDGILVTPPAGFEVSIDNITFTPTVTVGSAGTIASTPVYVRLAARAIAGIHSGNIGLTSIGAVNVDVATASSTVAALLPTITDLPVTGVTTTKAIMNATINDGGLPTKVGFYIGTNQGVVAGGGGTIPTGQDITYGQNPIPTISAGTGNINIGYQDNVVFAGVTYYYQARATNSAGTTVGVVGTFTGLPSQPLSVIVAGKSATTLSFDWPPVTGAISYTYDVATTGSFGAAILPTYKDVSTATAGATVTGLSPGTLYYIRVKAVSAGGEGVYSSSYSASTLISPNFTANYDFNSVTSSTAVATDPSLVPVVDNAILGSFTIAGATPSFASNRFTAKSWGIGTTINTSNYFSVTVTPASGYSLSLLSLGFTVQRTGVASPIQYSVRSSMDGYNADLPGNITGVNNNLTVNNGVFNNANISLPQKGTNIVMGDSFENLTGPVTFRIYVFNSTGAANFSVDDVQFTGTTAQLPIVTTTTPATNIAATTVTLSGNVSSDGGAILTDEGVVYSTSANPRLGTGTKVSASTTVVGDFSGNVTGLTAGTTYHYVAYATSEVGTSYGSDETFTTVSISPTISTTGTLSALSTTYGTASATGTFNVSGTNMVAGILVTPPAGFEVSADNITFTPTVTVGAAGIIASMPVYIRLAASNAATSYSGDIVLSSSGANDVNFATVSSTVSTAPLTITADSQHKVYGTVLPTLTASYSGFVNGDTQASLTTAPTLSTTATTASPVAGNPYSIIATDAVDPNYTISYNPGTLSIDKAELIITSNNAIKTYGQTLTGASGSTAYTITSGTLKNGNTISSVTVAYGTGSTATEAATTYAGQVTSSAAVGANGFAISNYTITYAKGDIIVGKKALTATATGVNKVYDGSTVATVSFSDDRVADDQLTIGYSAAFNNKNAGTGKPVSVSSITISGGSSGNYTLAATTTSTSADIVRAIATVRAQTSSKVYNNTIVSATAPIVAGLVGGDAVSILPTQTFNNANVGAGKTLTASGLVINDGNGGNNYTINYTNNTTGVITAATLTYVANSASRMYGIANPVFTGNVTGFVGGDTQSMATTGTASYGTTTTLGTLPGNYAITGSGLIATNYVFVQAGGNSSALTITKSTNANLGNLATSTGTLSPVFATGILSYQVSVTNVVTSMAVTSTVADASATIKVNGITVSNGSASVGIPLNEGENVITTVVTAQDGITRVTYTVLVYRAIGPGTVRASNILSPNGDGVNDSWEVKDILLYPNNTVTIYDRAGRIIFTKKGYANDWNATLNGSPLTEGTYYYSVDLGVGAKRIVGFITVLGNSK